MRNLGTSNPTMSENPSFNYFEEQNSNPSDIFNLHPNEDSSSTSGIIDLTLTNASANKSNPSPS